MTRASLALLVAFAAVPRFAVAQQGKAPAPAAKPVGKAAAPVELPITAATPQAVAAMRKGWDLFDNQRVSEAIAEYKKALELDPKCALCKSDSGFATPGPDGLKMLEEAVAASASLSEAERLYIQSGLSIRSGNPAKCYDEVKKLASLVPGSARAQAFVGQVAQDLQRDDEAEAAFKKANQLAPNWGPAYYLLAYTEMRRGKTDPAIAHFKKYVELNPDEPNAYDSLADAQLKAGQFAEAEASYRKAADTGKFPFAWNGVAVSKMLRGDFAGGREALAKNKEGEATPREKLGVDRMTAFALLAEGKTAEANKAVDALAKAAKQQNDDAAAGWAQLFRAAFLFEGGKYAPALKQIDVLEKTLGKSKLVPQARATLEGNMWILRALTQARAGKKADLDKTAAAIDAAAKKTPDLPIWKDAVTIGHAMATFGKGDAKGAAAALAACTPENGPCQREQVLLLEKAGDQPAADAARKKFVDANLREVSYVYFRSTLMKK